MAAELMLGEPLFPGDSGVDQLVEIIKASAYSTVPVRVDWPCPWWRIFLTTTTTTTTTASNVDVDIDVDVDADVDNVVYNDVDAGVCWCCRCCCNERYGPSIAYVDTRASFVAAADAAALK